MDSLKDPSNLEKTAPPEEQFQLTPERIEELAASLREDTGGIDLHFLDSINSAEELEQIRTYIEENNININTGLLDRCAENLEKWPDPESELGYESFKKDFPLTADKLNTPQKIRIFLRFVDFCRCPDLRHLAYISPYQVARITERILHEHEVIGKDYVEFEHSKFPWEAQIPEKLAYFTQGQAWVAQDLLFPGKTRSGSDGNLFIDWRKQEGEK